MIALDAGLASVIGAVAAVIVAGIFRLYGVREERAAKREASKNEANAITVDGYHSLLSDYRSTISELQSRMRATDQRMRVVEQEAVQAKEHADSCDRALRAAVRRIAALERASDGPS